MLADITLTVQEFVNLLIAAAVLVGGQFLRSVMLDALARLRFLMGFITLLAKSSRDIHAAMNAINERELSPSSRMLFGQVKLMMARTEALVEELTRVPEKKSNKMDSSLITKLEALIHGQDRRQNEEPNKATPNGAPDTAQRETK